MLLLHDAISQKNIGSSRCSSQQEFTGFQPSNSRRPGKLLIERSLITEAEFMQKLSVERVNYQRVQRRHQRASC